MRLKERVPVSAVSEDVDSLSSHELKRARAMSARARAGKLLRNAFIY